MTIGKRILAACGLLVVLTGVMAGIALYRVSDIRTSLAAVTDHSLPTVYNVGKMAQLNRVITGNILLHLGVPSVRDAMETKIAAGQAQFRTLMQAYGGSIASAEETRLFEAIPPLVTRLDDVWTRLKPISRANDSTTAWKLWMDEGRPILLDLEAKLNAEIDLARAHGLTNANATNLSVKSARLWMRRRLGNSDRKKFDAAIAEDDGGTEPGCGRARQSG